jgi:hypothetical protein
MTKPTNKNSRPRQHTLKQVLLGEFDNAPIEMRLRMIHQLQRNRELALAAIKRLLGEFWE